MKYLTISYKEKKEGMGISEYLLKTIEERFKNKSISLYHEKTFVRIVQQTGINSNGLYRFILIFNANNMKNAMVSSFYSINQNLKEIYFYIPDLIDLENQNRLEIIKDHCITIKFNNKAIFMCSLNESTKICSVIGNSNCLINLAESGITKNFFTFILKVLSNSTISRNYTTFDFIMPDTYDPEIRIIREYYNFKESKPFNNYNSGNDLIYFYNDLKGFLKLK